MHCRCVIRCCTATSASETIAITASEASTAASETTTTKALVSLIDQFGDVTESAIAATAKSSAILLVVSKTATAETSASTKTALTLSVTAAATVGITYRKNMLHTVCKVTTTTHVDRL